MQCRTIYHLIALLLGEQVLTTSHGAYIQRPVDEKDYVYEVLHCAAK